MGLFKNKDYDDSEQIEEQQELEEQVKVDLEEEPTTEDEKRERRRQRRKKNELMVTIAAALVIAVVSGGIFAGVNAIRNILPDTETVQETVESDDIQDLVQDLLSSETELPTEVVPVVSPEEKLDEYLDTLIAGMTLDEKIYGLIITSPEELTGVAAATRAGDGTKTALETKPVGGLVYYRKNMEDAEQLKTMLSNTMSYSKYPMFLAVNEGGDSASSVQNSAIEVPSVKEPQEIASVGEAYALGNTIGTYLADLKFNVNFAPTADVLALDDAFVKNYSFGKDSAVNAQYVTEFVIGLEEQGISATLKTFPGTGNLTNSTANGTVSTDRTRADYESDFTVFKAGIEAGADFVMVSHVVASELSGGMEPCSMSSSVVTNILRGEFGYDGIVITEPMNVKAITEYYEAGEAAVAALKAGCDMILLPEDLDGAYKGILEGVQNGSVAEARINDSLKRVMRVKYADKLNEFAE